MLQPSYPIVTERLWLRPYHQHDFDALLAIHSRDDVNRYLYTLPRDGDGVQRLIDEAGRRSALRAQGDTLVLGLERRDNGGMIGNVILHWASEQHRQGEIGFVLHPAAHGQGFAREASLEMLRLGFDELHLHRITGRCDGRNGASARVLERLGMRREAHLVENEWVKGEWTDELVYAMLAGEWRAATQP